MAHKKLAMGIACVAMASVFAFPMAACDPKDDGPKDEVFTPYTAETYDSVSERAYDFTFSEFYDLYSVARAESTDLAKRYALMAQAEAKLYESGVLLPTQAQGGNYAVSKVANATVTSVAWGNDSSRLHYAIVATTPIKATDRAAMRTYRNEHAGDNGAAYLAWMRTYLQTAGYTTKNEYNMGYTSDPKTFDVLSTSNAADTEPIVNTYDGLIEYDVMNNMQPALAKAIPDPVDAAAAANPVTGEAAAATVTFTFEIRSGAKWIDSQGVAVADVKADDFVAGFQHMLDTHGGLEYLVDGVVVGADEYLAGEADFDAVKVVANESANTVTYTVYKSAESYFLTMLSYSVFAPLSRTYYTSKGGKFGSEFNPAADDYNYGKSYESIAYCGPYYISQHIKENKMVFTANPTWWNKDTPNARNTETINWLYNDGKDVTKAYTDFKSGTIDGCGLTGSNVESAKTDKLSGDTGAIFDTYAYTSAMDSTAFCAFLNINRGAYANVNDGAVVSAKTEQQKEEAYRALLNVHFRRALVYSVNRITYMSQVVGADLAEAGISNMYTPGTFVQLPAETTIKINGVDTTFAAGTQYGEIVQAQLTADGSPIVVWKEVKGDMSYTGFDGWYHADEAKDELAQAIEELYWYAGIEVSADHPIVIDYPYFDTSSMYKARAEALKKNIEEVLEKKVQINLVPCATADEWQYAGYWIENGSESNFDIYDLSGWGPDYGDPQTYLDTMLPDYAGYMTKCFGIF